MRLGHKGQLGLYLVSMLVCLAIAWTRTDFLKDALLFGGGIFFTLFLNKLAEIRRRSPDDVKRDLRREVALMEEVVDSANSDPVLQRFVQMPTSGDENVYRALSTFFATLTASAREVDQLCGNAQPHMSRDDHEVMREAYERAADVLVLLHRSIAVARAGGLGANDVLSSAYDATIESTRLLVEELQASEPRIG